LVGLSLCSLILIVGTLMTCISPGQNVTYYYYYLHCVECIAWNVGYCYKRCDVTWSIYMYMCLSVGHISGPCKTAELIEMPKYLCVLPMIVAQSSSGGVAIRYVLPVLSVTSCLYLLARNKRHVNGVNSVTRQVAAWTWNLHSHTDSPKGSTGSGRVWCLSVGYVSEPCKNGWNDRNAEFALRDKPRNSRHVVNSEANWSSSWRLVCVYLHFCLLLTKAHRKLVHKSLFGHTPYIIGR